MSARTHALLLLSLGVAGGAGCWWQWHRAAPQRAQLSITRVEIERERAQHERLVLAQISEPDLTALRADRAAVTRLRDEVNTLAKSVNAREQALAAETDRRRIAPALPPVPDLVLQLKLTLDGELVLDGRTITATELRDRVAGLPPGRMFEVQITQPKPRDADAIRAFGARVKAFANSAREIAKQQGLKMSIRFQPPE